MKHNDPLVESIKKTLDQHSVDDETRRKLTEARLRMLDDVEVTSSVSYRPVLLAFASVAALAIAISLTYKPGNQVVVVDNIAAFEIITSQEPLDMYEDLEFYVWLDGQLPGES